MVEVPRFIDNPYTKVVSLSALRTDRLFPPGNIPGIHVCYRPSRPQGHSAAGRIISMKNSNGTVGNRNRGLPVCSAVPQTAAPPRDAKIVTTLADSSRRTDGPYHSRLRLSGLFEDRVPHITLMGELHIIPVSF